MQINQASVRVAAKPLAIPADLSTIHGVTLIDILSAGLFGAVLDFSSRAR